MLLEEEPATASALFGNEKFIATPHLGASTSEAQENVALQVAEQISDYLLTGAVVNALNMPSISADEAKRVGPWISLAQNLGAFALEIFLWVRQRQKVAVPFTAPKREAIPA